MGSLVSRQSTTGSSGEHVTSESGTMSELSEYRAGDNNETTDEFHDSIGEDEARVKVREDEMEKFKTQLLIKREQRKEILDRHRAERAALEKAVNSEIKAKLEAYETNKILRDLLTQNNIEIPENLRSSKENSDITDTIVQMREEFEKLKASNKKLRMDLVQSNSALQSAYSDIADLSLQNTESIKQIHALKEVVSVSKTMINLREQQLTELKNKLSEIERSLADREASMLSADLRQEYERQLQNIRTLRGLYEERARLAEITRQGLVRDIEEQRRLNNIETNKSKDLTAKVEELEAKVEALCEKIENKNNEIISCQGETRNLQEEMTVVNKLFSQVLLGYKTKQDLDKLVYRLEENHGILTHMAEKENGSEASTALPKMLLELINQIDENEDNKQTESKSLNDKNVAEANTSQESDTQVPSPTSAEEIVENLPKVWRVLMELLSHQTTPEEPSAEKVTTCYKSVETKSGPVLVPSVSQTYIRLKDLIVEKLALIKEVNRMKQLNSHLESRLEEQEKKLCSVTTELTKTWHVVGRLRRHHHQLHTHEKILKYELQQKRKLLNELKEELVYCKEKWDQAREKNSQSEKDFKKLRTEFSSRKIKNSSNNSAESGYSDEKPTDESSESNDESEYATEPLIRSKKKFKKSFETIVDSSTNCAAEREDPASDLIDVADLPLDARDDDDDDNNESCNTESCNTESLLKSEKISEETEDEIEDIASNSCTEECTTVECKEDDINRNGNKKGEVGINTESIKSTVSDTLPKNIPAIDPAAISKSIAQQNERLAKREKKLGQLEKCGESLLKQTQTTVNISNQIDTTLDHILNRPCSSKQSDVELKQRLTTGLIESKGDENDFVEASSSTESTCVQNEQPCGSVDFKTILESVKLQNERLVKTEQRLQQLEEGCSEVVHSISNTLLTGKEIIEKLDNLHNDHRVDDTSEILKNENICEETEDEIENFSNNSYTEECLIVKASEDDINRNENKKGEVGINTDTEPTKSAVFVSDTSPKNIPEIDPVAIPKSIAQQNERLANVNISNQVDTTLDHILNRPCSSKQSDVEQKQSLATDLIELKGHDMAIHNNDLVETSTASTESICVEPHGSVDFKAILESVKLQNKRLTKKEQRLQKLEDGCSEVVNRTSNTIVTGAEILEKLDNLHNDHLVDNTSEIESNEIIRNENIEKEDSPAEFQRDSSEPSTSSDTDHEARFAARDLRLKRLEEQTKSLVTKVNKTTTKGVKINYKLEELHSLYGSENSRAGTPSEDNEETLESQNIEDNNG